MLAASLLLASPAQASTDYIIDSEASCNAFLAGIGGTGSWDGGATCYVRSGTLPSGDTLTVTGAARLRPQMENNDTTAVDFRNEGTITFDSDASGGLYIAGRFENAGTLNFRRPAVQNYATLDNSGVINMSASAGIYSSGTLRNSGTLNAAGDVQNAGTLDNTGTGTVTASGVWSGIGSLSNAGTFTHSGTSTMTGAITNTGTFTHNSGSLALQGSNSGTFQNLGGTVTVSGAFSNSGTFVNASGAVVQVSGTFTNECTGSITGDGTFTGNPVVNACNTAPVAVADSYSTDEDTALTVAVPGVLDNDSDDDEDPLTAALVAGASNGTLTLNTDGSFSYTPNPDFNGSDSFDYYTSDGTAISETVTVAITVNPVNDAPTVAVTPSVCTSDTAATGRMLLTLADIDSPVTGVTVQVTSSNTPLLPNNRLDVTGTADARTLSVSAVPKNSGTSTLTVLVTDPDGATSSATILVVVGSSGGDTLTGSSGVDMVFGLAGANTLLGLDGADLLCGGNGADTLDAGTGHDVLTGGRGPDRLLGGDGDDHLTGGRGGDFFSGGTGEDTLADLTPSEGDTTDNT